MPIALGTCGVVAWIICQQIFWFAYINPDVMVGKPTIRGLRITVEQILKALAGGITTHELLEEYPELEIEDIQAVLL